MRVATDTEIEAYSGKSHCSLQWLEWDEMHQKQKVRFKWCTTVVIFYGIRSSLRMPLALLLAGLCLAHSSLATLTVLLGNLDAQLAPNRSQGSKSGRALSELFQWNIQLCLAVFSHCHNMKTWHHFCPPPTPLPPFYFFGLYYRWLLSQAQIYPGCFLLLLVPAIITFLCISGYVDKP